MRKILIFILFAVIFFTLGCASVLSGMLRFQDRELLIHPDKNGLAYPYRVTTCKRKFIFKKCKTVQKIDFYDLSKKKTRDKLINAGFTCKSKMRFKY